MRETRVALRYAHALFLVAKSRNNIDIIASELSQLRSFVEKDKRFIAFLEAPQILVDHKIALIKSLFTARLSPPLLWFLFLLIEKHRIEFLGEIAREFEKFVEDFRGLIKAHVTTAIPIDNDFKMRLKAKLETMTGKEIEVIHRIDRQIIGGVIVRLNFKIIDNSIRNKLEVLRHDLLSIKVY
jgi:F-type H+-transporting ATPase subunit delta